MKFKRSVTGKRKAPSSGTKVRTKDGKIGKYYSTNRSNIAYQTKYRLPMTRYYRQRISSKKSSELSAYEVHNPSNLSRIEYEIDQSAELTKAFADLPVATHYFFLQVGFRVEWRTPDKKINITCKYLGRGDREYFIKMNDEEIFRAILDSPVIPASLDDDYD